MRHQILDHQVRTVQLLHKQELFIVTSLLLPFDKSAEHRSHVIVLPQRQCQALPGYVVLEEAVPLNTKVLNLFVHPLESVLGRPNSQFVIYDFLDQIFLQDGLKFLTSVLLG